MSSSTINSTDGNSAAVDEALYSNSKRTKNLLGAIDKALNEGEQKFRQSINRYFLKPVSQRVQKAELEQISGTCDKAIDDWRNSTMNRINEIISEDDIKQKLYSLDQITAREKTRPNHQPNAEAWRPTAIPTLDVKAYSVVRTLERRDHLLQLAQELKTEVAGGQREVERGRVEVEENDKAMLSMAKELKAGLKICKAKVDEDGNPKLTNEQLKNILDRLTDDA